MNRSEEILNSVFYLTIEPYCCVSVSNKSALVYNSLSKEKIIVEVPKIIELMKEFLIPENGMTLMIDNKAYSDSRVQKFVKELRKHYMGDIFPYRKNLKKPFQLIPKPYFEKEIDKIKSDNQLGYYFSNEIVDYLNDVYIYLTNDCTLDCVFCNQSYKQTTFCTKFLGSKNNNNEESIFLFLEKLFVHKNIKINFLGGDITLFPRLERLFSVLLENNTNAVFYIYYRNIVKITQKIDILSAISNFSLMIFVDFPLVQDEFDFSIKSLLELNIKITIKFVIESLSDYEKTEAIINKYSFKNYEIEPRFNGVNEEFIRENIFLNKTDIKEISTEMKEIFSNREINNIDYGKLIISSDGNVYGNLNFKQIGHISKDNLFQLVYSELSNGDSWRRVRIKEPCGQCVYQYLCPSPSNIELAMGDTKICTLKHPI